MLLQALVLQMELEEVDKIGLHLAVPAGVDKRGVYRIPATTNF